MTNVWTKEDDLPHVDYSKVFPLSEPVKTLYLKHITQCNRFIDLSFTSLSSKHDFYVYAWYADTRPKKYFYVGKGTKSRYRHILSDIKAAENGKDNIRFQWYKQIKEKNGIGYEFFLKNLSEVEALIYEECVKLELLSQNEVLLNVEGIPSQFLPDGWYSYNDSQVSIIKHPFYERYLDDYNIPFFDSVSDELLTNIYFYPYFIPSEITQSVFEKKSLIINWLHDKNAKIYKSISTKTKSVIVPYCLYYDRYKSLRENGLFILSMDDVVDYIKLNTF